LRSSTKIVVGFVALAALMYFGYQLYAKQTVASLHFDPVVPGEVNLVGIDPGAGYQIIVANDIAQLVEASTNFEGDSAASGNGPESGAIKKRLPIKEMLGVLRGDPKDLGDFVAIMNDLRENEKWPTVYIVWQAEDIQKALAGDKTLEAKLVRDLNVKLDGTPLAQLRPSALENGIIIDFPVSLHVNMQGQQKEVVGRIRQPYKPTVLKIVEEQIADKQVTPEMMAGYYGEAAKDLMSHPEKRENVRTSLENFISKANADRLREAPERILQNATVVANEHQIKRATTQTYDAGNKKLTDLTIELTDEGRQRLWKYSVDKVGSDLLLIVQGVAVAAPRIERALTEQELTIKRMPDPVLAQDTADRLNAATKSNGR
jgi:hypothetical protein